MKARRGGVERIKTAKGGSSRIAGTPEELRVDQGNEQRLREPSPPPPIPQWHMNIQQGTENKEDTRTS